MPRRRARRGAEVYRVLDVKARESRAENCPVNEGTAFAGVGGAGEMLFLGVRALAAARSDR